MTQMDIVCITATCNTDCDMIIQVRGVKQTELFAVLYVAIGRGPGAAGPEQSQAAQHTALQMYIHGSVNLLEC